MLLVDTTVDNNSYTDRYIDQFNGKITYQSKAFIITKCAELLAQLT